MSKVTAINKLSKVQRHARLGITRALRTTPTAALETLLNISPLQFLIMREARVSQFRLESSLNYNGTGKAKILEQLE